MPISRLILEKYPNPVFIETAPLAGDGIQTAIDAGFRRIIAIEASERNAIMCRCRFEDDARVRVFHGDADALLTEALSRVGERATLWLDVDVAGDAGHATRLLAELDAIAEHGVKGHTLLIGGARELNRARHGFALQELMARIRKIDDRYRFWFEPSGDKADGILVARFV